MLNEAYSTVEFDVVVAAGLVVVAMVVVVVVVEGGLDFFWCELKDERSWKLRAVVAADDDDKLLEFDLDN